MSAGSNFGMVFYAVALLYSILAMVVVCRTWERLFKCQKYINKQPMRIWRTFYAFMWIYIALNLTLYWTAYGEYVDHEEKDYTEKEAIVRYVVLSYVPVILSSLSYTLLYY